MSCLAVGRSAGISHAPPLVLTVRVDEVRALRAQSPRNRQAQTTVPDCCPARHWPVPCATWACMYVVDIYDQVTLRHQGNDMVTLTRGVGSLSLGGLRRWAGLGSPQLGSVLFFPQRRP